MKKFIFILMISWFALVLYGQTVKLSETRTVNATIKSDDKFANTDDFEMFFYSNVYIMGVEDSTFRERAGFQAKLKFQSNDLEQVKNLETMFKKNERVFCEFKIWGKTAKAKCRIIEVTSLNTVVNIRVVGVETLKY